MTFVCGNFFDLTSDIYNQKLTLYVIAPDKHSTTFIMGLTQPLEEMFEVYCCRHNVSRNNMKFSIKNTNNFVELFPTIMPLGLLKNRDKIYATLK